MQKLFINKMLQKLFKKYLNRWWSNIKTKIGLLFCFSGTRCSIYACQCFSTGVPRNWIEKWEL